MQVRYSLSPHRESSPNKALMNSATRCYCDVALKLVIFATALFWTSIRKPQYPDWNMLSVTVTIQFAGSELPICQAFAESVEPKTLKRKV